MTGKALMGQGPRATVRTAASPPDNRPAMEIKMAKLFTTAAIASALLFSASAYAIDVENQDATEHEVTTASGDGDPVTFKLKPGEIKRNVCGGEICNVMVDSKTNEFEASKEGHLAIKGGKLIWMPKRG